MLVNLVFTKIVYQGFTYFTNWSKKIKRLNFRAIKTTAYKLL